MRAGWITIVPMLAAAVLTMVGGERLARREIQSRTPVDRQRLFDFAEAFGEETDRLDDLYLTHLARLARLSIFQKPEETAPLASEISGIRLMRVFRQKGGDSTITPSSSSNPGNFEVELKGRKRPFNPARTVILDSALLEESMPSEGVWLPGVIPTQRIHCRQPEPGVLVAFLLETPVIRERSVQHLATWVEVPLAPLREAGESMVIEPSEGNALASIGPAKHGPSAMILPKRTLFCQWQIQAWDGLSITHAHDSATLTMASLLAVLLAASGVILYFQQKRALLLASQRVSFVNRVSHELGTPLTNLSLNLDLALDDLETRPGEARRRLGLVDEEIGRLSRLVANVLTFSRHERDTLEIKPVPCRFAEVVRRTLESFRPALERRGIRIEVEITGNETVLLDPDALSQITGNLLSNVEKYAADGQWMRLACEMANGTLTLEVWDHGPGIPFTARHRVFTAFERVLSSTNEGASGTGLGLSIARDLARLMGGTLDLLDSTPGAAFKLRIPAPAISTSP